MISFQVEAGAVNYLELADVAEKKNGDEILPEANYARISDRGRALAENISPLQHAIEQEDSRPLEDMVECELSSVNYRELFNNIGNEQIQLLASDTLSSLSRIEQNLCQAAELVQEYLNRYRS